MDRHGAVDSGSTTRFGHGGGQLSLPASSDDSRLLSCPNETATSQAFSCQFSSTPWMLLGAASTTLRMTEFY
jgi:hypothetical protein